jgi:hypothetical protein
VATCDPAPPRSRKRSGLRKRMRSCDLVLTGEGRLTLDPPRQGALGRLRDGAASGETLRRRGRMRHRHLRRMERRHIAFPGEGGNGRPAFEGFGTRLG